MSDQNILHAMAAQASAPATTPAQVPGTFYATGSDTQSAAQPTAAPAVPIPQMLQPPPLPDVRRTGNLMDIAGNAGLDTRETLQGLSAIPGVAVARGIEVMHGQPLLRQSDWDTGSKLVQGIFDEYKRNYYDPIVQGQPQNILHYAAQHPLYFGLDVAPLLKPLKVGQLAGGVAKGVAKSAVGQAVASAGKNILHQMAEASPAIKGGVQSLQKWGYEKKLEASLAETMGKDLMERRPLYGDLMESQKALPEAERAAALSAAEATHPEVLQRGYAALSDAQRVYLDKLRVIAAKTEERVKALGHVTDQHIFETTYSPLVRPIMRRKFGVDINFDELAPHEKMQMLKMAKTELDRLGVKPIYQARMHAGEVQKLLNEPLTVNPGMVRIAAQRAGRGAVVGEDLKDAKRLGREIERKADRGEKFHANSAELAIAADIQVSQAFHLYNTMLERIMAEAKAITALSAEERAALDAGLLTEWHPREVFRAMGRKLVAPMEKHGVEIADVLPERVVVPTIMAEALEEFGKNMGRSGALERTLSGFANFARRYILGFNAVLPEVQGMQNFVMLGLTQFKGPRNTLLSMSAYALAHDKNVLKMIPPGMIEEMFQAERTSGLRPFGIVEKAIDANFNRLQKYDRYARAVATVQYALEMSEKMPEMRPLITGMVDSMDAIQRLEKVFANPEAAQAVAKQVLTVLGDYTAATAAKRSTLRSLFLWWMWTEHITKFGFHLPANNPFKASIMGHLAKVATDVFQNPNAPEFLNKAGAVPVNLQNDQGLQYHVTAGNLNPMTGFFETIEMITAPFDSSAEGASNSMFGAMNPLVQLLIAAGLRVNPGTGREFQDPNMLHQGGQQFKPQEYARGIYNPQKPTPNLVELAGRYFLGRPVRAAERIYAKATTGGEPSQFTELLTGTPAPRKGMNMRGEAVHAPSWVDMLASIAVGINPMAVDPNAAHKQEIIEKMRMKKGWRAAAMQGIKLSDYRQPMEADDE